MINSYFRNLVGSIQCVGPVHREYRATVDEITALCLSANEFEQALPTATRNLALSVQIDGLDSAETINQHLRLASVHMGMAGQVRAMLAKSVHTTPTESVLNGAVDAELCNATPKDTTAAKEETVAVANRLATEDVLLECKRAVLNHLQVLPACATKALLMYKCTDDVDASCLLCICKIV